MDRKRSSLEARDNGRDAKRARVPDNENPSISTPVVVQFYSKSKDVDDLGTLGEGPVESLGIPNWRKVLSNFHLINVTIKGKAYPSVEHYFHAAKAMCSTNPEFAKEFEIGGTVGQKGPLDAKRAGSKAGFARAGAQLDVARWISQRDRCVARALRARARQDTLFRQILLTTHKRRLYLLHFERLGRKSYWGGSICKTTGKPVGTNRLGTLLMTLRNLLAAEEQEEEEAVDGENKQTRAR